MPVMLILIFLGSIAATVAVTVWLALRDPDMRAGDDPRGEEGRG
jgi:hypothetical protein